MPDFAAKVSGFVEDMLLQKRSKLGIGEVTIFPPTLVRKFRQSYH
jgi:hypothetical protein